MIINVFLNSREMILIQLLDIIVSNKIKVIPDLYHHYLSTYSYHAYKSNLFHHGGSHISVTMVTICSNKLFFKLDSPSQQLGQGRF